MRISGDDWAFGPVPPLLVAWTPESGGEWVEVRPFQDIDSDYVHVSSPDGGLVGQKYALSGKATVQTIETTHGQIRLVVPESVSPRTSPDAILDALETVANDFDDGGSRGTNVVFVVPQAARKGGATFLSTDETWVAADTRLHTANNVWFHEYVHTRQDFELGPQMRWFEEASAEYFGARLAADAGYASVIAQEVYWLSLTRSKSRLTEPATWAEPTVPYERGALVLAALDSEIRTRTDGQQSLEDVFRKLNRHDGVVTYAVFVQTVNEVTGEDMKPWLDRFVAGDEPVRGPTMTSTALTMLQTTLPDGRSEPIRVGLSVTLLGGVVFHRRKFES